MKVGTVQSIMRYPVKSMGGEQVDQSFIDENGVLDANLSQVFANRPRTVGLMLQLDF